MVKALRELRVPVLRVEREYSMTGEGQLRTRIQAFLESMGK
jgi:benzoyl-CoA reductase/2-hydroxyglutaryl-CoA dehydratase subunit BcrC/BadD/HgdB